MCQTLVLVTGLGDLGWALTAREALVKDQWVVVERNIKSWSESLHRGHTWHTCPVWPEAQGPGLDQPGEGKTSGDLTASPVLVRRWARLCTKAHGWRLNGNRHKLKWEFQIGYKEKKITLRISEYWKRFPKILDGSYNLTEEKPQARSFSIWCGLYFEQRLD